MPFLLLVKRWPSTPRADVMLDHFNNEYVYLFDMFVVILLLKIRKYQYERLMVSKKKNDTHTVIIVNLVNMTMHDAPAICFIQRLRGIFKFIQVHH